jgi:DNA primase
MQRWYERPYEISKDRIFSKGEFSFNLKTGDYVKLKAERTGLSMAEATKALMAEVATVHAGLAEYEAQCKAEEAAEAAALAEEQRQEEAAAEADKKLSDRQRMERQWERGRGYIGTPGEVYLKSRNILPNHPQPNIRFCWSLYNKEMSDAEGHSVFMPALMFKVVNAAGEMTTFHRVYLKDDGSGKADLKEPKKVYSKPLGGGIYWGKPGPVLCVAEGPESAMSVAKTGAYTVSALDADKMRKLDIPPGVKEIIFCGDNDDAGRSGVNRAAATLWRNTSLKIRETYPTTSDKDFNDVAMSKRFNIEELKRHIFNAAEKQKDVDTIKLCEMQDKYVAVGEHHGHPAVAYFIDDEEELPRGSKITVKKLRTVSHESFIKKYRHEVIKLDGGKEHPLAHTFLDSPNTTRYERIVFKPGLEAKEDELNLDRGFAWEPKEGDCQPILDFYRDVICSGNEGHCEYLIKCWAIAVQKPWLKWGVVIALITPEEGTGKGTGARWIGEPFGQHCKWYSGGVGPLGEFNEKLMDGSIVIWNEAEVPKRLHGTFSSMVTENKIQINPKNKPADDYPNRLKLVITSNSLSAIKATLTARRIFAPEIDVSRINDKAYFTRVNDYYDYEGGKEAFLHHLKYKVDISNFDPMSDRPNTEKLQELKEHSLDPIDEILIQIGATGVTPESKTVRLKCLNGISTERVSAAVVSYCEARKLRVPEQLDAKIKSKLRAMAVKDKDGKVERRRVQAGAGEYGYGDQSTTAPWCYLMPPLEEYRKNFKGFEARWDGENIEWSQDRLRFVDEPPSPRVELAKKLATKAVEDIHARLEAEYPSRGS